MSTTVETRTQTGISVAVTTQTGRGRVSLLSPAYASAEMKGMAFISVGYRPFGSVGADLVGQPTVNVGMVYTSTISDDLEVWWCDQWKMLWNKNTKVLWPEESV